MKHTGTLIAAALLLSSCATDTLHPVCGNVHGGCYGVWNDEYQDPQLTSEYQAEKMRELAEEGLVGPCQLGRPTCDENYKVIDCEGAVYPESYDTCDGIDNNCDGKVDNGYYPRTSAGWYSDEPNPCPSKRGVCASAEIECKHGEFVCYLPSTYETVEQSCDGLDNDCNIVVDDIDPRGLCFDGELWEATNGICRAGVETCKYGEWVCDGQVLPSAELCDGVDNDCNGIIDDSEGTLSQQYDIVFVVDTSGSMCSYIEAVAIALLEYVDQFNTNSNFKFSLVIMSNNNGDLVAVEEDFTDIATLQNRLSNLDCNGSGWEASLDSMHMVCDLDNPLELSWREDSNRLMFVFTDEPPQTYATPLNSMTSLEQHDAIVQECLMSGTLPFTWTLDFGFDSIAIDSNGLGFNLRSQWEPIFDDMNSIVITLCGA